jgi:hypothetical protein
MATSDNAPPNAAAVERESTVAVNVMRSMLGRGAPRAQSGNPHNRRWSQSASSVRPSSVER